MTIAIGINLGLYTIFAADTRVTYKPISGAHFYDDNNSKIQKTKMGLITGAGFCPILDGVKAKLAIKEITNTNQILEVINEETERINKIWQSNPNILSWIEMTGWIFSYLYSENGQITTRVAIFHPSLSKKEIALYRIGLPAIIYPVELDRTTVDSINEPILKSIKIPVNSSEVQISLEHNFSIIVGLITTLQPLCPSISRRFQIGIQYGNQMGISELTDIQNDAKFNLKY